MIELVSPIVVKEHETIVEQMDMDQRGTKAYTTTRFGSSTIEKRGR
jgi:hypothetical protein